MRFLADECCPRSVVERLRADGHDVLYAAEIARRAPDASLLARAASEQRIVVTEDFDFGDLVLRDRLYALGVIILFLAKLAPGDRAARLARVLASASFVPEGFISIVTATRIRQRAIT